MGLWVGWGKEHLGCSKAHVPQTQSVGRVKLIESAWQAGSIPQQAVHPNCQPAGCCYTESNWILLKGNTLSSAKFPLSYNASSMMVFWMVRRWNLWKKVINYCQLHPDHGRLVPNELDASLQVGKPTILMRPTTILEAFLVCYYTHIRRPLFHILSIFGFTTGQKICFSRSLNIGHPCRPGWSVLIMIPENVEAKRCFNHAHPQTTKTTTPKNVKKFARKFISLTIHRQPTSCNASWRCTISCNRWMILKSFLCKVTQSSQDWMYIYLYGNGGILELHWGVWNNSQQGEFTLYHFQRSGPL